LLADALKRSGMRQDDLARRLDTTQSSVSGWINGKYEPAAETVFAIERALNVDPGHLSRPLGYLPVDRGSASIGVEAAIAESLLLDGDEKAALLAMYHVLVTRKKAVAMGDRKRQNDRFAPSAASVRARSAAGGR
jgi:transcriptional regulator with XRE-family HTH domain